MPNVTFDGPNKIIIVNNGVTQISVKTDLYSDWKEWVLTDDNSKYLPAFRVIGGDNITETVSVDGTYFLINGWRIRPYEGNHVLTISGNLYVDGGGSPVISTLGTYNVLVNLITSNIVNLVTVSTGSAVTSQDKLDIISGVGNNLGSSFTTLNDKLDSITTSLSQIQIDDITSAIYNTLSPDLNIIKGLVQHNFRFTDQTYNSSGTLETGKIKIYNNTSDLNADLNVLKMYDVRCFYDSQGRVIEYVVSEDV